MDFLEDFQLVEEYEEIEEIETWLMNAGPIRTITDFSIKIY
jgi:hypothetical protein